MPIRHLQDRRRYLRLGKIRLGIQVPVISKETGKPKMRDGQAVMRPKATDYFVVKGEVEGLTEQLLKEYGDKPTEFDISFLFERDEETFPQFLKHYRGDGMLRCIGDGDVVHARRFFDRERHIDEQLITGGAFLHSRLPLVAQEKGRDPVSVTLDEILDIWGEQYGWGRGDWKGQNMIPCLGETCPQFKPTGCRATARLLFAIRGVERLGFWEIVVHQQALIGINSQLELTRAFTSKFLGRPTILHVPFKMRTRGPYTLKVNGRKTDPYWLPEIEPDPQWITDVCAGQVELPKLESKLSLQEIKRLMAGDYEPEPEEEETKALPKPEDEEPLDYDPTAEAEPQSEQIEMAL